MIVGSIIIGVSIVIGALLVADGINRLVRVLYKVEVHISSLAHSMEYITGEKQSDGYTHVGLNLPELLMKLISKILNEGTD